MRYIKGTINLAVIFGVSWLVSLHPDATFYECLALTTATWVAFGIADA